MRFLRLLLIISFGIILTINTVICSNDNLKIIRLPNNTIPFHYKINLIIPHLEEINPVFYGESNIDIVIHHATKNISLHSRGLEINELETTLFHKPYTFYIPMKHSYDNVMNILTLHFENTLLLGTYTLNMKFSGIIFETEHKKKGFMKFPYTNKEDKKNSIMAATYFELNGARKVFPCWDEPELKAIFNISVMHHQKYLVLSNGQMKKQVTGKDDMIQTLFASTPRMSTYLVAIVVIPKCDFYHRSNYDQTVNIWCSSSLLSKVTFIYNITEKVAPFMTQYTNRSLQEVWKMDHVLIPNFPVDGMENWGLITYNEYHAIYDMSKHSIYKKIKVAKIVTHELIHQWFNLVTPTWPYLWLKEGFATFLELYIIDKIFEGWRTMDLFVTLQIDCWIDVGSLNSVTLVPNSTFDDMSQYSMEFYGKVPVLLRMLHHMITDEVFQKGLITYLAKHQYSSATPDDLWSAMQSALDVSDVPNVSHYRIKNVMDTWINQNSYPEVNVRISNEHNSIILLSQKCIYKQETNECINNTCINNTCTNKWWIPITFATRSIPNFSSTVPIGFWLRPYENISQYILNNPNDWIIINIQQIGYYRVTYDISNWQKISYYLNFENYTNIHSLNRAQVIRDLFASVLNEQISGSVFISLIKYLNREEDIVVWHSMFPIIQRLWKYFFLPEATHIKRTITSVLGSFLQKIGFSESSHDDDMVKLTRLDTIKWACILGNRYCRNEAAIKLSEHLMSPNVYEFPRWTQKFMYCTGLMTANRTTWDKTLKLYQRECLKKEKFENSLKQYQTREKFIKLLLRGLSCAENSDIIINFLNIMALKVTFFNEKHHYFAILCILKNHSHNNLILEYILNNFKTIKPRSMTITALVTIILSNVYSRQQIYTVNKFAQNNIRYRFIRNKIEEMVKKHEDMLKESKDTFHRQFK